MARAGAVALACRMVAVEALAGLARVAAKAVVVGWVAQVEAARAEAVEAVVQEVVRQEAVNCRRKSS